MRYLLSAVVALSVLFGLAQPSHAQAPGVRPSTAPAPELDLRIGAMWPEQNAQVRASVGGRLALRPWSTGLLSRVSLQVTGDFRSLGGDNGFDDAFQVRRRITRHRFVAGGAVGFDVLRTERMAVDVRVGVALTRTRTNFLIDSSLGFVDDGNQWENVCPFQGFKERCGTDYDATPTIALGVRRDVIASGNVFVGVDYTALGQNRQILAGTVGLRLR